MEAQPQRTETDSLDVTEGVIWRQLVMLLWPVFVASFVQQAYQLVNTFVVGRFASTVALGGMQATQSITELAVGFSVGVGAGCAVIVGQSFGARDEARLSASSQTAMALSVVIGLVVGILGLLGIEPLLLLIDTPESLMSEALGYSRLVLAALPFVLVYNMGAGIMRAVGDTRTPTRILAVSLALSAVLDMAFVAGLRLESAGCGISYLLSYLLAAVLTVAHLAREGAPWRIDVRHPAFDARIAKKMLLTGLPLGVQSSAYSISNIVVQSSINQFGAYLVTGWGLANRIDGVIWQVADALGIAVTTFSAQNYGARRYDRMRSCMRISLVMGTVLVGGLALVMLLLAGPIARFFVSDEQVVRPCLELLGIVCPVYSLYSYSDNVSGLIRGSGESLRPMIVTLTGTCFLRIAWVAFLMPLSHTEFMLMMCYPVTWAATDVLFLWYYLRGRWLNNARIGEAGRQRQGARGQRG